MRTTHKRQSLHQELTAQHSTAFCINDATFFDQELGINQGHAAETAQYVPVRNIVSDEDDNQPEAVSIVVKISIAKF